MRHYRLQEPLGSRPLAVADFPLSIGGAGAGLVLPGCVDGELVARLGLAGDAAYLQPLPAGTTVLRAGVPLAESAWLDDGDRFEIGRARLRVEALGDGWTLCVEHDGGDNATEPPLLPEGGAPIALDTLPARQALAAVAFEAPAALAATATRVRRVDPRRAAALVLGALALGGLAFLMAASAVTVRVLPDQTPDRARFEGALFDLGIGSHRMVLPGRYRLHVEKQGYVPGDLPVTVTGAAGQQFDVALAKHAGRLRIDTRGVPASVTVDGKPAGRAPGELALPAGVRTLLIEAPRRVPFETRLEVEGLDRVQDLQATLAPRYAAVRFESVPAGAAVVVDGIVAGTTPVTIDLDEGRRLVSLTHPLQRTWEAAIVVKAGEPQTVGPVTLGLPDGQLVVSSEPPAADVSVAGAYRGRTPVTLALPPGVVHEVLVTRAGYVPVTRGVRLEPGGASRLALALTQELGEVEIDGEPADAELTVDGKPAGRASQRLRLQALLAHALEVRKNGLEPFRVSVTPRAGLLESVHYVLHSAVEQQALRFQATIRTAAGQTLKLLPQGRFRAGSPRREPGRRSNENERVVELRRPVYLALRAVTNQEYRASKPDHLSGAFQQETLDLDSLPVANVSWAEAAEYCNGLSARDGLPAAYQQQGGHLVLASPATTGYRLPTEAEWEYAARWNGGANDRKYPWGSGLPIPPQAGNFADRKAVYLTTPIVADYDDGFRVAAPVGSFAPNPLGFYDLGGNVLEWVSDSYTVYAENGAVLVDPAGPASGELHVLRGSSWLTGSIAELRLAWRDSGSSGRPNLGFRIARYAE